MRSDGTRGDRPAASPKADRTERATCTSRVVFISNGARETRARNGFRRRRRSLPTGGPVPNRVPKRRPDPIVRKEENPAVMRDRGWRDPDSNRGHHDFQSWAGISLTPAESLQIREFSRPTAIGSMCANCVLSASISALVSVSVPNRSRPVAAGLGGSCGGVPLRGLCGAAHVPRD